MKLLSPVTIVYDEGFLWWAKQYLGDWINQNINNNQNLENDNTYKTLSRLYLHLDTYYSACDACAKEENTTYRSYITNTYKDILEELRKTYNYELLYHQRKVNTINMKYLERVFDVLSDNTRYPTSVWPQTYDIRWHNGEMEYCGKNRDGLVEIITSVFTESNIDYNTLILSNLLQYIKKELEWRWMFDEELPVYSFNFYISKDLYLGIKINNAWENSIFTLFKITYDVNSIIKILQTLWWNENIQQLLAISFDSSLLEGDDDWLDKV